MLCTYFYIQLFKVGNPFRLKLIRIENVNRFYEIQPTFMIIISVFLENNYATKSGKHKFIIRP